VLKRDVKLQLIHSLFHPLLLLLQHTHTCSGLCLYWDTLLSHTDPVASM